MENKSIKFEDKIKELENIITDLENGEIDLEDSIEKYTKAMLLVKECDDQLKNIEEKVNKIVMEDGSLKDFSVEETGSLSNSVGRPKN